MLRVFYSSALELLVDALVEGIASEKADAEEGPLIPVQVIIPSRTIASFLKMAIAKKTGIAANLRFVFLERFLPHEYVLVLQLHLYDRCTQQK